MKKVFSQMNRCAKNVFIAGWIIVFVMLTASTVLYIGAGNLFDYYISVDISEKLLAGVRPVSLAVCLGSLALEHYSKQKEDL